MGKRTAVVSTTKTPRPGKAVVRALPKSPAYLHHPDLAPGTSHFRMGIEEGLALVRELRAKLSGLAMPAYMLDIPGGFGKVPLESMNVEKIATGHRIRDARGEWHLYPPSP